MIQYNGCNYDEISKFVGNVAIEVHAEFMYLIFSKSHRLRVYVADYIESTQWGGFRLVKGDSLC